MAASAAPSVRLFKAHAEERAAREKAEAFHQQVAVGDAQRYDVRHRQPREVTGSHGWWLMGGPMAGDKRNNPGVISIIGEPAG